MFLSQIVSAANQFVIRKREL